jgi:hypothetical protein
MGRMSKGLAIVDHPDVTIRKLQWRFLNYFTSFILHFFFLLSLKTAQNDLDTFIPFQHTWGVTSSHPSLQPYDGTAKDLSYKEKIE